MCVCAHVCVCVCMRRKLLPFLFCVCVCFFFAVLVNSDNDDSVVAVASAKKKYKTHFVATLDEFKRRTIGPGMGRIEAHTESHIHREDNVLCATPSDTQRNECSRQAKHVDNVRLAQLAVGAICLS